MCHAEGLVHARSDGIDRGSTADFIVKFGANFFATGNDLFAFFVVWIPGVFSFGASFLAESRKSNLREAIFDDFVARREFVCFPIAEFFGSLLNGLRDFSDLVVS